MPKLTKAEKSFLTKYDTTSDIMDAMRYLMSSDRHLKPQDGLERAVERIGVNESLKTVLDGGMRPKTLAKMSIAKGKEDAKK